MAPLTCELVSKTVPPITKTVRFKSYYDNQTALHMVSNLVFRERTKCMEINYHFIEEKLLSKEMCTEFVESNDLLEQYP